MTARHQFSPFSLSSWLLGGCWLVGFPPTLNLRCACTMSTTQLCVGACFCFRAERRQHQNKALLLARLLAWSGRCLPIRLSSQPISSPPTARCDRLQARLVGESSIEAGWLAPGCTTPECLRLHRVRPSYLAYTKLPSVASPFRNFRFTLLRPNVTFSPQPAARRYGSSLTIPP